MDFSEKKVEKIEKFIITKEKEIKNKVKNNEYFDEKVDGNAYEIRLRLTKKGMMLANDVFVEFIWKKGYNSVIVKYAASQKEQEWNLIM